MLLFAPTMVKSVEDGSCDPLAVELDDLCVLRDEADAAGLYSSGFVKEIGDTIEKIVSRGYVVSFDAEAGCHCAKPQHGSIE